MKHRNCRRNDGKSSDRKNGWASMAIAGAAMLAATACGGCLYTAVPAMAGPSTTYPQPADGQPAAQSSPASQASQPSQQSNDQTNQSNQNKQQNGMPPNGAQPQGQGGTL
ncbi:MAG: hypothetical protein WB580_05430 [Candidatus Binataceae bacterium]